MSVLKSYQNAVMIFRVPEYSVNISMVEPIGFTEVSVGCLIKVKKAGASSIPQSISMISPTGSAGDSLEIYKVTGRIVDKIVHPIVFSTNECKISINSHTTLQGTLRYSLVTPSAYYNEAKILGVGFYGDLMLA